MATNDFLPFATAGGANVVTQAAYAALPALSTGYQAGVAASAQLNKTWRQSSIMAAVLAQFAADYSGNNSTDDGTTATLEANLVAAIRSATKTGVILADTGAANAYTAVNAPPLVAGTWVDGVIQQVKIAHANTGASTYAPDGLTAIPIYGLGLQPLQGGELALNGTAVLMHATIAGVNSGNPITVLMECAGGAQQVAPATQSQHAVQLGQAVGRLLNVQYFRSSGTYTPTPGTTSIVVEVQGGGGGGGGAPATGASQYSSGGNGSSGCYALKRFTSGFSGATVTIGAGGNAGSGASAGGGAGLTSFAATAGTVSAGGGYGGQYSGPNAANTFFVTRAGYPPAGSNGDVNIGGNPDQQAMMISGNSNSAFTTPSAKYGTAYGSGGGGATGIGPSTSAGAGTAGTSGVCVVWEYS